MTQRRRAPMAWGDREGRVPRKLRHLLRGLRNNGSNDVAIGVLEDDDPMSHVGSPIGSRWPHGLFDGEER